MIGAHGVAEQMAYYPGFLLFLFIQVKLNEEFVPARRSTVKGPWISPLIWFINSTYDLTLIHVAIINTYTDIAVS